MIWRLALLVAGLGCAAEAVAQCVECAQQTTNAYLSSQTTRNSLDAGRSAGRHSRQPSSEGRYGVSQQMLDRYPGIKLHQERRGTRLVTVACANDRGGIRRCRDIG